MSETTVSLPVGIEKSSTRGYHLAGIRFNWISALFSLWLVGGLYLDGWAHRHGRVDDVFFTPWHAVLYSGVFVTTLFLLANLWINHARGYPWRRALPQGYMLSLLGAGLFLAGGGLDLAWHELFGIEVDIETLLSPTHLLLATSGVLMISGSLRSAWAQAQAGETMRGWARLGPAVLALTLILSVLTFFTQFSNPLQHAVAQKDLTLYADAYPDLYTLNADGSSQTRLTAADGLYTWTADWSPDGKQVVFARGKPGFDVKEGQLYIMNRDGSGLKQLTQATGQAWTPAWSPDGTRIAFIQAGQGTHQLSVLSASGGEPRQLTKNGDNWGVSWSPDGQRIVYHSERDGSSGIYAVHPDGSGETLLANPPGDNLTPAFSPDGRQIAFANNNDHSSNIYVIGADGANPRNLTHNYALDYTFPRWSPDGSTLLVTAAGHSSKAPQEETQSRGITGILLLAALLAGCALLLLKSWQPPFGSLTLMFSLNAALVSVLSDTYWLVPPALLGGLACDLLVLLLKPSLARPAQLHLFAFALPVVYFALYFLGIQLHGGIGWTIHLWLGLIFMAGAVGLFVSLLLTQGLLVNKNGF